MRSGFLFFNLPILMFRQGFATNSSSSSSILLNLKQKVPSCDGFLLQTKREKIMALLSALIARLEGFIDILNTDEDTVQKVYFSFLQKVGIPWLSIINFEDVRRIDTGRNYGGDGYPQAILPLKHGAEPKALDPDFFRELVYFMLQDSTAVALIPFCSNIDFWQADRDYWIYDCEEYGGVSRQYKKLKVTEMKFWRWISQETVCRKDRQHGYWVLFSPDDGVKFTVSFSPGQSLTSYRSASTPELADIKITDYCDQACGFCYENSTINGKHAEISKIYCTIDALAKMSVFEVAFGGGDPVSHPDFSDIIRYTRKSGIIPNFSTRNLKWLKSQTFKALLTIIGSVGFTPKNLQELEELRQLEKEIKIQHPHVGRHGYNLFKIHIVENALPFRELLKITEYCVSEDLPMIFLGMKTSGRGNTLQRSNWPSDWIRRLPSSNRVDIDTAMARRHLQEWVLAGYDVSYAEIREGTHSFYIDCCSSVVGRSSYEKNTAEEIDFNYPRLKAREWASD